MAAKEKWILGIHVSNQVKEIHKVQPILTKFGCSIKTRLGIHDICDEFPNSRGLLLIELTGNPAEFPKLENELLSIDGLDVRKMVFPVE
ncbi:MAG: hypothetical protein ACM3N9_08480 [Syntrophothermus sp.]